MNNIRTILFDLDGTLIDTNELIIESFLHTFQHYGYNFSQDEIISFNGPPLRETFEKINLEKADEMIQTYRKHNLYHHDQYVKPFPYVVETIKKLKKMDVQLGIVTTKMQKSVEMGLNITGLTGLFDTVVTLDDVTFAKPHPEPVLMGMERLNAAKESTIMVGDNSHDIESGHNAEVRTAGVAWTGKGKEFLKQYNPTYMLEDIRDLLTLVNNK